MQLHCLVVARSGRSKTSHSHSPRGRKRVIAIAPLLFPRSIGALDPQACVHGIGRPVCFCKGSASLDSCLFCQMKSGIFPTLTRKLPTPSVAQDIEIHTAHIKPSFKYQSALSGHFSFRKLSPSFDRRTTITSSSFIRFTRSQFPSAQDLSEYISKPCAIHPAHFT